VWDGDSCLKKYADLKTAFYTECPGIYLTAVPKSSCNNGFSLSHSCILNKDTMNTNSPEKRNVTTEQAVKVLQKNGVELSEKKMAEVLDFMYFLAKLALDQYLKDK